MLSRRTVPVLIGICLLSGMFLMGQDTWGPVPQPTITDIVPAEGYFDDEVAIWGTNFGADQGGSTVTFKGLDAGVALSWSPQTIVINVPIGATSGPVVVTVGGLASNGFPFTVWPDCVEDADCDDGNQCTDNICDPEMGTCSNPPLATGTPCDDGNPCTVGDICQEGLCNAGPCGAMGPLDPCCEDPACEGQSICEPAECTTDADCDDGNECTTFSCDYPSGICSYEPKPDGLPCDNGNACTTEDTCSGGVCVGGPPLECDDGNVCNGVETCDQALGCQPGTPLDCDDGNVCTDDTCDPALGCLYECTATGPADPCCADPACAGEPACAATIHVPDPGSGIYTVQDGIDAAVDGDEVVVAVGTYVGLVNFNGKAITVRSASGPEVTILESSEEEQVVSFTSGEGNGSVLRGFTIQKAGSFVGGSGIRIAGASPVIEENIIQQNTPWFAGIGGGIYVTGGSPVIRFNTIRNNKVSGYPLGAVVLTGGGIVLSSSGAAEITNNFIQGNTQKCGPGHCARGRGAGIYVSGGSHRIIGNVISGNRTGPMWRQFGAGILISATDGAVVANNTIYGNSHTPTSETEEMSGAGVFVAPDNVNLLLANNIVQGNNGQGVLCYEGVGVDILTNAYFGNPDGDIVDCPAGAGDLFVDAGMADPAAGDFRLTAASPVIDAGTMLPPGMLPALDIHGNPRILDGNCDNVPIVDIGAYEFLAKCPAADRARRGQR